MCIDSSIARTFIGEMLERYNTPSASVAVGCAGNVHVEALGYADLENGIEAAAGTVYSIASITKVYTAVAVMKLVEEGKLGLEDPADKYLPVELRVKGKPVTIEHLLSHTSGIPALGYAEALVSSAYRLGGLHPVTRRDVLLLLERAARDWAVAEPGERFFYLNEGYVALGYIVERVSGLGFWEYVRREILGPLNARYTYFSPRDAAASGLLAKPYMLVDGKPSPVQPFPYAWSDGGIYASAVDVLQLMESLAGRGPEIVSRSTVKEMVKPRALMPLQLFGDDSYGLGLAIYPGFPGGQLVGHSGGLPGYHSFAGFTEEASIAVLSNGGLPARDVAMALLASPREPWSFRVVMLDKLLSNVEGRYSGYRGMVKVCVERVGDGFIVSSLEPRGLLRDVLLYSKHRCCGGQCRVELYARRGGRSGVVEVLVDFGENRVELFYERYRLIREGPC